MTAGGQRSVGRHALVDGSQLEGSGRARRDALRAEQASRPTTNPARRADLSQPVPADQRDQLPTKTTKHKDGTQTTQLTKDAFVYDPVKDCFWCPHGQQLKFRTATKENPETRSVDRRIYAAPASACADCPLRAKCLNEKSKADHREINRDEHDDRLAATAAHRGPGNPKPPVTPVC